MPQNASASLAELEHGRDADHSNGTTSFEHRRSVSRIIDQALGAGSPSAKVADGGDSAGGRAQARAMPTLQDAFDDYMAANPSRSKSTDGLTPRLREPSALQYIVVQCIGMLCTLGLEFASAAGGGRYMEINKDLMAASSTPIVLAILADGDSYGYAILQRVREVSGGRMKWTDGMLYPVLHRLERLGHVEARWEVAETGRRRKYYRITPGGWAQLDEERKQWQAVDATLRGIWRVVSVPVPALAAPLSQGA